MKPSWKDYLRKAVMIDETGRIVGAITEIGLGQEACYNATFSGESLGDYISRETARKAVEAAAARSATAK